MTWEVALVAGTVIATGSQVISGIQQAEAAEDAARMDELQAEENEDLARIEALQEENRRRRELRLALGANRAAMAAQGQAIGLSPSAEALERGNRRIAAEDIRSINLLGAARAARFGMAAEQARMAGRAARQQRNFGWIGPVANAATGFARYRLLGGPSSGGTISGGSGNTVLRSGIGNDRLA